MQLNEVDTVKLTGWVHVPCFAHTLNLIVQHGLKLEQIAEIRSKVKIIIEHFHRSTLANFKLFSTQSRLQPDSTPLKLTKRGCNKMEFDILYV